MTVTGQSKSGSATSTTSSVVAFSVDDAAMDDGKRGRCSEYEIIHIFACFFGNYVCPLSHINPTVFFCFPIIRHNISHIIIQFTCNCAATSKDQSDEQGDLRNSECNPLIEEYCKTSEGLYVVEFRESS